MNTFTLKEYRNVVIEHVVDIKEHERREEMRIKHIHIDPHGEEE